MSRILFAIALAAVLASTTQAQEQKPPPFATTKVEGTENVYVFRYGGRQAMFVVTRDGVIATDPIGYGQLQAVTTYVDEIKKITDKPIKYLIYSHHHYDHIAGGKPFKDAGAKIIAHKRAKERLAVLKDPTTPLPDETIDKKRTLNLGGTNLELAYVGLNHSDSSIVMRLPKEKLIFVVDFLPVGTLPGRGMIDFYPLEAENAIKQVLAMDWESASNEEAPAVTTENLGEEVFASTIQASVGSSGGPGDMVEADDLDEAEIERSIREINEAIRRSANAAKKS